MPTKEGKIKKPNYYLPLLLLFIFADILCDNYVFRTFHRQSPLLEVFLFGGILLLQIVAAPIQAGFSDFYCRKKSLVLSLSFSLLALVFVFLYDQKLLFYFPVLLALLVAKGALGNTIPLAWASIADTQEKNFRFSFGLSTASFAVGYLILIIWNMALTEREANIIIILIFFVLLCMCILFFKDIRDKTNHPPRGKSDKYSLEALGLLEIKEIIQCLKRADIRNGLWSFFLWEVSLYSVLLLNVDFDFKEFTLTPASMMLGYLFGVVALKFCDSINDKIMIRIGYGFSVLSLVPFFIFFPFFDEINFKFLSCCYFFHSFGNAFLCSTFFAMLCKENASHEQGKNYGLISSEDTFSFLVASIALICYKILRISLDYIIIFSILTAAASWIPYQKFERMRPKKIQ